MVKRYRGGVLSATQIVANNITTSGFFNLGEAAVFKAANNWPLYGPIVTVNGSNSYTLSGTTPLSISAAGFYTLSISIPATLNVQLWGGGGATGTTSGPSNAGAGGYANGLIRLNSGTNYVLIVGAGAPTTSAATIFPDGGFPFTPSVYNGGGGGGSTRIGLTSQPFGNIANSAPLYNNTSASYYLIAGGGGGSSIYTGPDTTNAAGQGGGLTGTPGGVYYPADGPGTVGGGASQSAGGTGGAAGRMPAGNPGGKYSGGRGYYTGGGGGYYGGGGGGGYYSQSGGGSGYIDAGNVTNGAFAVSTTGPTAYICPNPTGTKPTNAGNGGTLALPNGNDGAAVLTWAGY